MITIYSSEGIEYLPRKIIGRDIEDCREWQLVAKFMRWLTCESLSLFERPIKLIAIFCLWWPVNLYG
ncbi:hypothetical protein KAR91_29870 [Candidatus Pacearchaeota archaeon]|nr:hypothetical protein [Candidatus Pacearchaeota archaeon]